MFNLCASAVASSWVKAEGVLWKSVFGDCIPVDWHGTRAVAEQFHTGCDTRVLWIWRHTNPP